MKSLPDMVHVNLNSGASVTIEKSLLLGKIEIDIKSFHGSRKIYTIETSIDSTIEAKKEGLMNVDTDGELKDFLQINLIYTIVIFIVFIGKT